MDTLLATLDAAGVVPHISGGPGGSRLVLVTSNQLPDSLIAVRSCSNRGGAIIWHEAKTRFAITFEERFMIND